MAYSNFYKPQILKRFLQDPFFPSIDPEMEKQYESATGVNMEEQRQICNMEAEGFERAKGYLGEYRVFSVLYKLLDYPSKMLMNVQIPAENGNKTEIDLLLFSQSGIYVFEIKDYSGKVYGGYSSPTWTEYYKTRESVTFENPVFQNEYHVKQLRRLLPDATLYSYIVFSDPVGEIKANGRYPGNLTVVNLMDLAETIQHDFSTKLDIYSPDDINSFFEKLMVYSPLENIPQSSSIIPFSMFQDVVLTDLRNEKERLQAAVTAEINKQTASLQEERKKLEIQRKECRQQVETANKERDKAQKDLENFAQNFEVVKPYPSDHGLINRDCFKAEVQLEVSTSFLNTTNLFFRIQNLSKELWIETRDSWFIIGLKNGHVQKYILNQHVAFYGINSKISPNSTKTNHNLAKYDFLRLFNVAPDDIQYIKLCNSVVTDNAFSTLNIAPGIEFEMYTAPGISSVYNTTEADIIKPLNEGVFSLNPDIIGKKIVISPSSDGTGSDISFQFSASSSEMGFDLSKASFIIGIKDKPLMEYNLKQSIRNFSSQLIMPLSKTILYLLHLDQVNHEDIIFIQLKDIRVFRKDFWGSENLSSDVVFSLFSKDDE